MFAFFIPSLTMVAPWACKDKKLVSLKIPTDPSCIWSTDSKQCLDKSDGYPDECEIRGSDYIYDHNSRGTPLAGITGLVLRLSLNNQRKKVVFSIYQYLTYITH